MTETNRAWTHLPPLPGEGIRDWVRRYRKEAKLTISEVGKYGWAYINVPNFQNLIGVGEWLEQHVSSQHYVWSCEHFWFTREEDAVMFKLTWVDKAH